MFSRSESAEQTARACKLRIRSSILRTGDCIVNVFYTRALDCRVSDILLGIRTILYIEDRNQDGSRRTRDKPAASRAGAHPPALFSWPHGRHSARREGRLRRDTEFGTLSDILFGVFDVLALTGPEIIHLRSHRVRCTLYGHYLSPER